MVFSLIYVCPRGCINYRLHLVFIARTLATIVLLPGLQQLVFSFVLPELQKLLFPIKLLNLISRRVILCLLMLIHLQRKGMNEYKKKCDDQTPLQNINNSNIQQENTPRYSTHYGSDSPTFWKLAIKLLPLSSVSELVGPWWNQETAFLRSPSMFLIVLV